MSLQRRLLVYLLISAPLVWLAAGFASMRFARHEVDELFDTELIRLARQVQVTLAIPTQGREALLPGAAASGSSGEADVGDLAIAVWARDGRLLLADREGVRLPYEPDAAGFVDLPIAGEAWRVYYLQSFDGAWLVAAGQKAYEREELAFDVTLGQVLPWLAMLPLLLVAMAWGVRRALAPVRQLSENIASRGADELQPVATDEPVRLEIIASGPLLAQIRLTRRLNESSITQIISLRRASRRLEFETTIDWQEKHKLLKVAFPTNIHANAWARIRRLPRN